MMCHRQLARSLSVTDCMQCPMRSGVQELMYAEDLKERVRGAASIAALFRRADNLETLLAHPSLIQVQPFFLLSVLQNRTNKTIPLPEPQNMAFGLTASRVTANRTEMEPIILEASCNSLIHDMMQPIIIPTLLYSSPDWGGCLPKCVHSFITVSSAIKAPG